MPAFAHPYGEAATRAHELAERHRVDAGLEGDDEDVLVHIIADFMEWCDASHIDFDKLVELARGLHRNAA